MRFRRSIPPTTSSEHLRVSSATEKTAKKVWLHWAEGRIHGEYDTFDTPTGKIPLYKDLKVLFKKFLDIGLQRG